MAKPIIIIHFQPLELYPPVMNLILYLANLNRGKIIIFTTAYNQSNPPSFKINSHLVSIRKIGFAGRGISPLLRYLQYFKFYSGCFFQIIKIRPRKILYFETLSSWPVYLYKKYINRKADILAHYHEYTSPAEYENGMRLSKYFHKKEEWLYPKLSWLSHTNKDRLLRFLADEGLAHSKTHHVMPNYPGKNWLSNNIKKNTKPKRIVYAGAVSQETMYLREFIEWVLKQEGHFTFDIFSYNISDADGKWLLQHDNNYIRLHPGVDYYALPGILRNYDIGVILYKGHIPNYVLNAPNKLFEYLASGLDVWVSEDMIGSAPYYTADSYPKVLPVGFQKMDSFNWQAAIEREGLRYQPPIWNYEMVYPGITEELFSTS